MNYKLKKIDISGCDCMKPCEEKDMIVVLEKENRSAIHGVVKFPDGRPVKNAVVKLFLKKGDCCDMTPITFTFTDECGQFLFGVDCGKDYVIKVFFYTPENQFPISHCKDDKMSKNCCEY